MSLSLQMLADLLGKDPKTISRWCEAGLVPGAYRLRGGNTRQGKWRVRFPRINQQDGLKARYQARRANMAASEYAAMCALDRLTNRIADNTRDFRRRRVAPSKAQSLGLDFGGRIYALDQRSVLAEMANLAARRAEKREPEGNLWLDAFNNLGRKALAPMTAKGTTLKADNLADPRWLDLAKAKGRLMLQQSDIPAVTLPALCRELGIPKSLVRKDPRLAELLKRQTYRANRIEGVRLDTDVITSPDYDTREKTNPVRGFSPTAKKMYRDAAEEAARWIKTLSPDQIALMGEETFAHLKKLASKAKPVR